MHSFVSQFGVGEVLAPCDQKLYISLLIYLFELATHFFHHELAMLEPPKCHDHGRLD